MTIDVFPDSGGDSPCRTRAGLAAHSTADVVAFLGDRYKAPPGWEAAALASIGSGYEIAAGPVLPSPGLSFVGWAAYLIEYSHIATAEHEVPLTLAPGANIAYRRHVLDITEMQRCLGEMDLHQALASRQVKFKWEARMAVQFLNPSVAAYLRERVRVSSAIAAHRMQGASWTGRMMYALTRVGLPLVLFVRTAGNSLRAGYGVRFAATAPAIAALSVPQVLGEIHGAVTM